MTQECIRILFKLSSRSPNHSSNLALSIPYSSAGEGGGGQINEVLGLCNSFCDLLCFGEGL